LKRPFSTLIDAFEQLDAFDPRTLEETLRLTAEREGVKAGALIHATRVAATGRAVSPGLFEVLELLGRDRTVERMRAAARLIPT
jgi:glutamyl/glutaminyl-tRNA synthetase